MQNFCQQQHVNLCSHQACCWHVEHEEGRECDATALGCLLYQSLLAMFCGIRWVYAESGWSRIAALAPPVVACAQDGDQVAHQILQEGAADLVTTVQAVVNQLHMRQPFKLVLAGVMQQAVAACSLRSLALLSCMRHCNCVCTLQTATTLTLCSLELGVQCLARYK